MSTSYFVCAIICKLCVQYWPYGKIFQHGHLDLDLQWAGTFESNFLKTGNMGLRPVCFWALQMWSSLTGCFMLGCFSESCQLSCCFSESSSQLGFFSESSCHLQKQVSKVICFYVGPKNVQKGWQRNTMQSCSSRECLGGSRHSDSIQLCKTLAEEYNAK